MTTSTKSINAKEEVVAVSAEATLHSEPKVDLLESKSSSEIEDKESDDEVTKKEEVEEDSQDIKEKEEEEDEEDDSDAIPEEFICPLTLEIFTDPLMDRRGMNFEREAIVEWLNRGNSTCPLTREPLGYRSLIPNVNLRARVEHWKKEHGYDVSYVKRSHQHKFVGLIDAPKETRLELRWTQDFIQQRAQEIIRRIEQEQREEERQQAAEQVENSSRRRRRRGLGRSGDSPATQQRRLAGFLGDALNIVRRPPLVSATDES